MSIIPFYLRRPAAILKIPNAIARGLTVEGFIRELKVTTGTYRRIIMLSDWRSVSNIVVRKEVLKYVRKDRIPSMKLVADVEWDLSQEYMYKCKVWSETRPGEPMTERGVCILSDKPITPSQIESEVYSRWGEWEKYSAESLKRVQLVEAYHKIPSPLAED